MSLLLWLLCLMALATANLLMPHPGLIAALVLFVATPVASWLLLMLLRRKVRIRLTAPGVVGKRKTFSLGTQLESNTALPLGKTVLWLQLTNTVTGETQRKRVSFRGSGEWILESAYCGCIECRVENAWCYDLFGILPARIPCKVKKRIIVMPDTFPIELETVLSHSDQDDCSEYIRPFIAFTDERTAADRLVRLCAEQWSIRENTVRSAVKLAWAEQQRAKKDIRAKGEELLKKMEDSDQSGIVLTGRPYHIDPEINHGIPELIASCGLHVFTEDSLPLVEHPTRPLRVLDQWVYHSRLYNAAELVSRRNDLELVQLNSFGCGLDAVTTDQVCEILEKSNKLYTVLKIDEVNNLGAVRIRIRSLLAAMKMRREQGITAGCDTTGYHRAEFTEEMFRDGYTILAPQMSPIHFDILEPVFKRYGFNMEILDNDNRTAIDMGLKYVNNDACFPSITVVGQIMEAVLSGRYDTHRLAIIMTQTGGCCRASNYVGFIRRALDKAGLSYIPVISLNASGLEKNSGFKLPLKLLMKAAQGIVYGDLFMRCVYRVRPYECRPSSVNALHSHWKEIAIDSLVNPKSKWSYQRVCRGIVDAFDNVPIDESRRKPRVGIVGEILVKYMPLANNHLVELLEREDAEVIVPDLMDFMNYSLYNGTYKREFLGTKSDLAQRIGLWAIRRLRKPAIDALEASNRFEAPMRIEKVAELAKPFLSIGNQYGEGWFLTGEMVELLLADVPNIVCIQPFACLPNHVVGKGVIKALKKEYSQANIIAVDYDPGASEVNQLNRIKLMLSAANKQLVCS